MSKGAGRAPSRVGLGQVAGIHGLKGALKLRADARSATTDPAVIQAIEEVLVGERRFRVLRAERLKRQVLLFLEGVSRREEAETLVGREVWAETGRFPRLPPGEYYWFQVLGLPVLDAGDGARLGVLTDILPTPGHDVYVVRQGAREVLIPAVEGVVTEINLEEGWIKVAPPPGLLETYAD